MTNDTTTTEKAWHQKFWVRVVLVLVALFVILNILLITAGVGGTTARAGTTVPPVGAPTPLTVAQASNPNVAYSEAQWNATLAAGNQDVLAAALENNTLETDGPIIDDPTVSPGPIGAIKTNALTAAVTTSSGCHGSLARQVYIYLRFTSIKIAWLKVTQNGWCWSSASTISSWGGGIFARWTAPGYCFYNTSGGNVWWTPNWERKIYSTGTLRTCVRLSLQKTITAKIYYETLGRANVG